MADEKKKPDKVSERFKDRFSSPMEVTIGGKVVYDPYAENPDEDSEEGDAGDGTGESAADSIKAFVERHKPRE